MALDWERQAVIDELTQRINQGEFVDAYDALKQALADADALDERDQQRVVQFWLAKQREQSQNADG